MILTNKTFVITGGASGLGLATAETILNKNGNVVILDINIDEKSERLLGVKTLFVQCDVCSEAAVLNALKIAKEKFGSIHGIINCAGVGTPKRVVGKDTVHELSLFEKIVGINLVGTFNVIRLAVNEMQHNEASEEGERGIIINTASVAAFDGQIGQAAYSASKGGIVAMTLPLAREFSRMGIRVMTIAPGAFKTPLLASLPLEAQDSLGKQVPFPPRLGEPTEYAALAIHIIENTMLNGEVIRLDGAIRMTAK
jgi:NAD(P)-dependent dehydrogenase (short-subunit alcohol dehydrogenase family)